MMPFIKLYRRVLLIKKTEDIEGKIFVVVVFSVWQRLYERIFVVLNFFSVDIQQIPCLLWNWNYKCRAL